MPNSEKDPHYFGTVEQSSDEVYEPSKTEVSIAKFKPASVDKLQDLDENHELRVAKMQGKKDDGSTEERIVVYVSDRSRPNLDERNLDQDEYAEYIETHRVAVAREGTNVYDKLKTALNMSHLEMKQDTQGEWILVASTEDSSNNLRAEILGTNLAEKTKQKLSPEGQDEIDRVSEALKARLENAGEKFKKKAQWIARGGPISGTGYYNKAKLEDLSSEEVHSIAQAWVELYDWDPSDHSGVWKSSEIEAGEEPIPYDTHYVIDLNKMKDPNLKKAIVSEAESLWKQRKQNTREFYEPPTPQEEAAEKAKYVENRLAELEARNQEQAEVIRMMKETMDQMQLDMERQRIEAAIEEAQKAIAMATYMEETAKTVELVIKLAEQTNNIEKPVEQVKIASTEPLPKEKKQVGNAELDKSSEDLSTELYQILGPLDLNQRAQREQAVDQIMNKYGLTRTEANGIIASYRVELSKPQTPKVEAALNEKDDLRIKIEEADKIKAAEQVNWESIMRDSAKFGETQGLSSDVIIQTVIKLMKDGGVQNINEAEVRRVILEELGEKDTAKPKEERKKKTQVVDNGQKRTPETEKRSQVLGEVNVAIVESLGAGTSAQEIFNNAMAIAEQYRDIADIDAAEIQRLVNRAVENYNARHPGSESIDDNSADTPKGPSTATNLGTITTSQAKSPKPKAPRKSDKTVGKGLDALGDAMNELNKETEKGPELSESEQEFVRAFTTTIQELANAGLEPDRIQAFIDTSLAESGLGKTMEELGIDKAQIEKMKNANANKQPAGTRVTW